MEGEGAKMTMETRNHKGNEMDDEGAKVMMEIIKGMKWKVREQKG